MQEREAPGFARTPLEVLLARQDPAAHSWITERLLSGEEIDPAAAPAPEDAASTADEPEVSG